jgi:hypothetical protein
MHYRFLYLVRVIGLDTVYFQGKGSMDAEIRIAPPHRKDVAQADTSPTSLSPSEPPSLDTLTTEVQCLLAEFGTLGPDELRAAALQLRTLARISEAMARHGDH